MKARNHTSSKPERSQLNSVKFFPEQNNRQQRRFFSESTKTGTRGQRTTLGSIERIPLGSNTANQSVRFFPSRR